MSPRRVLVTVALATAVLMAPYASPSNHMPRPPDEAPSDDDNDWVKAALGIAAIALLVKYWLARERPAAAAGAYAPNELLALIPLAPVEALRAVAADLAATHGLIALEAHALPSIERGLLRFRADDVDAAQERLQGDARVDLAQTNNFFDTAADPDAAEPFAYGARLLRAERLRALHSGQGAVVALIDTGVDTAHPGLEQAQIETHDLSGRGFTPDAHGTLLAGLLAAQPWAGGNVHGLAPRARLLALKACTPVEPQALLARCTSLALARAVDVALMRGAAVINLSISGAPEKLLARLLEAAARRERLLIAAAGNGGPSAPPAFPAAHPAVLAVTAVDSAARLYADATRGDYVDLAAPGVEILSTSPGAQTLVVSGTSYAAVYVTAVAALLLERYPRVAPSALAPALADTAKDLGASGPDPEYGRGLLDACAAAAPLGKPIAC